MAPSSHRPQPWAPRYWPTWLAVACLRGAAQLPYPALLGLGRGLGRLLRATASRRRHIASVNVALCFPQLDDNARARLLRQHFESLGMGLLELALSWWASQRRLAPLVHIEGLQHLKDAQAQGRGVLLLSAHFTSLELTGRLLTFHHPMSALYRRHESPVLEAIMRRHRERLVVQAIPRDNPKALLRSLRANQAVWYAPDQSFAGKGSVLAPFFGVPAATNPATSRLARVSGAAVVPFFGYRLPGGQGYRLVLQPPLADFPTDDPAADATRINAIIQAAVREAPEQYYWVHRRFKDRPGRSDPY